MGGGYKTEDNGGTLTVTARVSNSSSRYAIPIIPELVYAALLYPDNDRPENPSSDKFVEGTKATDSDKLIFSFQRPDDTSSTFTLEVFAFAKADVVAEDGTKNFSINNAFLYGKKTGLTIDDDNDEIQVNDPIALSSGKPETVNLKIKVPDNCTLEVDDTRFTATPGGDDSNIYTVSADGISAGTYPVTFTVKKGDEIIHVFSENINVLKGLCTGTWWNGKESYAVRDVVRSISKTLYVRGTGGWYDATSPYNDGETAKASDDNLGSFSSPLASIQKAVDAIIARNDGESEYTICIDGTLKYEKNDENATYIGNKGMADFSSLDKKLNLTIKALSDTATLNGGAEFDADGNVIDGKEGIEKNIIYTQLGTSGALNLTIKNLVITAGVNSRGVYIGSRCALIMNNCEISRISVGSGFNGGAVYVDSKGAFTMESSTISGCKANNGGGVYNAGELTMSGVSIKNCSATTDGGGIYNNDTLTITGGIISECTATHNGGGIYLNGRTGNAVITNCTIKSCTANNISNGSAGGGGIYCYAQAFTITGGTISNCTSANQGGGISIDGQNFPFTIDGVEITDCNAKNGGGFFTVASATEGVTQEIKNCIIKSCTATTAGGGIGIYAGCNITVIGTEISDCVSPLGSGISSHNNSSLFLKDSTVKNDVGTRTDVASIYLAGSTAVTEGVINFSACTSTTSKPKLYVQDALTQSPIAKIKLGTVYQVGDAILQAADGYTLTEADCERFSIDGGIYDIALSDGEGVLVLKP